MRISDAYREANMALHKKNANYGTSGKRYAAQVASLVQEHKFKRILDYGCGKGTLAALLPELGIAEYDPAIPGKDKEPSPAELVVCTDVLEHIEPECLDDVLSHLLGLTEKLLFANISTRKASKFLADGRNAHLIVEQSDWWKKRVSAHAEILDWEVGEDCVNFLARRQGMADDGSKKPSLAASAQSATVIKPPSDREAKITLRKFGLADNTGDIYVNPDDVSTLTKDAVTEGVRIRLRSGGKDVIVKGGLAAVAKRLIHGP